MARFQLCLMRSKLIVVCFLGALFLSLANATSSVMNRTPLAATSFNDAEGTHIRVYYQATNGDIRETYYDQSTGWTTRPGADIVGHAKLNTGVAVTSWNNGNEIRVYYFNASAGNTVWESSYSTSSSNAGWTNGPVRTLSGATFPSSPYSGIAVINFLNVGNVGLGLRVFYQDATNKLRILAWSAASGWTEGSTLLPVAAAGTSISADAQVDAQGHLTAMRVLYQATNMQLTNFYYSATSSWEQGAFTSKQTYRPGAAISNVLWAQTPDIRVLTVNYQNMLCVTAATGNGWETTVVLGQSTITDSETATVALDNNGNLRTYYQRTGGEISEYGTSDGINWTQMQGSLPLTVE